MGTRQADAPQLFTFRPMDSVNGGHMGRNFVKSIGSKGRARRLKAPFEDYCAPR